MNRETEVENAGKLFDAMPKESYKDFILWLCINFFEDDEEISVASVVTHPLFLTLDEYIDWVDSYQEVEEVLVTLVDPLNGVVREDE